MRTGAVSTAAGIVAVWYDKFLMGSVGAIWTDVRRGSYLEFVIVVFRKFAGRESRWPSRVLRRRSGEREVIFLCHLDCLAEDPFFLSPPKKLLQSTRSRSDAV